MLILRSNWPLTRNQTAKKLAAIGSTELEQFEEGEKAEKKHSQSVRYYLNFPGVMPRYRRKNRVR